MIHFYDLINHRYLYMNYLSTNLHSIAVHYAHIPHNNPPCALFTFLHLELAGLKLKLYKDKPFHYKDQYLIAFTSHRNAFHIIK